MGFLVAEDEGSHGSSLVWEQLKPCGALGSRLVHHPLGVLTLSFIVVYSPRQGLCRVAW